MPDKPKTYDDIVRKFVPNPDSSMRPSREQEAAAYDGSHGKDVDEGQLRDAVQAALATHADGARVSVFVRDAAVELSGSVSSPQALDELEALARSAPGVGSISNKLVVSS